MIIRLNNDGEEDEKKILKIMKRKIIPYTLLNNGKKSLVVVVYFNLIILDLYKISDVKWIEKNFDLVIEQCSKVIFRNIDELEIKDDIEITKNIKIESDKKTNLNIVPNKRIYIK